MAFHTVSECRGGGGTASVTDIRTDNHKYHVFLALTLRSKTLFCIVGVVTSSNLSFMRNISSLYIFSTTDWLIIEWKCFKRKRRGGWRNERKERKERKSRKSRNEGE